jgi:hypothetical protein
MKLRLFAAFLLPLLIQNIQAEKFGTINNIHIGAGSFSEFMGEVQTTVEGEKNSYEFKPYLVFGADGVIYKDLSFIPELVLTIPESGRDEHTSRFTFMTLASLGYHFHDFLFKLGTGFTFTRFSSDGGTETLNNGTSTDDFFLPEESSYTRNMLLTVGLQYFAFEEWSIQASGLLYNLTDSESSVWSSLISINYHIDSTKIPSW